MATSQERKWTMQVIALYNYEPEEWDELRFFEGDILRVVRFQDDGWWCGYLVDEPEKIGVFPSNYVQTQHITPNSDDRSDLNPRKPATVRNNSNASVLQLKRSLAEAEKANEEAQEARKNAEKAQIARTILHSRTSGDSVNGGNNQKDPATPNVATKLVCDDTTKGTEALPPEKAHLMEKIIPIYKSRKRKEKKDAAAQKIYNAYRGYKDRMLEKQYTAATRIIRFMKKNIQKNKYIKKNKAASTVQNWYYRCKLIRADQKRLGAAIRIQQWIRPFLIYFQWKRKVDEIRALMAKERNQKAKRDKTEKAERNDEKLQKRQERIKTNNGEQASFLDKNIRNQLQSELTLSHSDALHGMGQSEVKQHDRTEMTKIKRKVIAPHKKEVEKTVNDLVKIQLDKRLQNHDEKVEELQVLVTKLQDVICKQNEVIKQSFDLDDEGREKAKTLFPPLDTSTMPKKTPSGIKSPRVTNSVAKVKLPMLR